MSEVATDTIATLARSVGLDDDLTITRLDGGANNRVYRVSTADRSLLLKAYYMDGNDGHDRLAAEYSFGAFLWEVGLRWAPEPLAKDDRNGIALFEYIEGRLATSTDVTAMRLSQAADFFVDINHHRDHPNAEFLINGVEACFAVDDHVSLIEQRIDRLRHIATQDDVARDVAILVRTRLTPLFSSTKAAVLSAAARCRLASGAVLSPRERCISPSDFGFHNAIVEWTGRLRFFDFEYAGWDDPARMVCDFLWQPAVPVPLEYHGTFTDAALRECGEAARQRQQVLHPLYGLKWCCIVLNEFIQSHKLRRDFAAEAPEDCRMAQLTKASALLDRVEALCST